MPPALALPSVEFPEKMQFLFEPSRFKVAYGGRMGLKCLGRGTKVLLYSGELRAVETIKVGDLLMGTDSTPREVLSTCQGRGQLYRIDQVCGISYVVNDNHILSLKRVHAKYFRAERGNRFHTRYRADGDYVNISVLDYLKKSPKWKSHFYGHKAKCIQFNQEENALPIHPYFLGLWLGDGTSRELRLAAHVDDLETIHWCEWYVSSHFGLRMSLCRNPTRQVYDIGFVQDRNHRNILWQEFLGLGLQNDKHIPFQYQVAMEQERLELLAGLIDSDGTKTHNGAYIFVNTNRELALGAKRLADFLGFKTSIHSLQPKMEKAARAYYIRISGEVWRIPCKLPRKMYSPYAKTDDFLATGIRVTPIGEGEFFGFSLDGDQLFLLEDGTVTHNSWSFARALLILGLQRPERVLCGRELQKSIDESVHKLLADQISLMGMNYLYDVQQAHILGRGSAQGTQFSFEGLRHNVAKVKSYEGITRCWVEEAVKLSKDSWNVLEPTIMRNRDAEIWLSLNPELDEDFIYQYFIINRPPPGSIVVKTTWRDNKWLPEHALASIYHLRDVNYDEYLHVYEGHTKVVLEGAIFADELRTCVEENRITHVPYERGYPVDCYFDLGYADLTCIWFVQKVGFDYRVIDYYQNRLKHIDHYLKVLQERAYLYGTIWLPHDAKAKTTGTHMSIEEQTRAAGYRTRIVPRLSIPDRINAARTVFPRCFFDASRTLEGIKGLRGYHYEIKDGKYSQNPDHEGSDPADAFTYFGVASGMRQGNVECKLELPKSVTERGLGERLAVAVTGVTERVFGEKRSGTGWMGR